MEYMIPNIMDCMLITNLYGIHYPMMVANIMVDEI